MRQACLFILLAVGCLTIPTPVRAQNADSEKNVFLDPQSAGPDYAVQGEYVTENGASPKYGAQVVAEGDGRFLVVLLAGGLPGDGWDGTSRGEFNARRRGDRVVLPSSNGYSGSFADGRLTMTMPDGTTLRFTRVERQSPRAGARPPEGAVVLFDGTSADLWQEGEMDERHLLEAGTKTKKKYQDFTLHVEYLLPFKPFARDQERGNSGIYIQDRYEIQILDTFGHPAEFNGCGALYRQRCPLLNMCYPPLQWQTYDIEFHAAKFDDTGKKIQNARVTVSHNGVIVQNNSEITNKTGAGAKEGAAPGAIQLQGHHNPVFFRNIWVIAN